MRREVTKERFHAILALVGGEITKQIGGNIVYHDGQTPPSESAIETKLAELKATQVAQEYARNRADEYPDIGSQLNKIYDDGLTKWKAEMVDPVKTKWPKDNSGPVE
jgi:hypothetical protein